MHSIVATSVYPGTEEFELDFLNITEVFNQMI